MRHRILWPTLLLMTVCHPNAHAQQTGLILPPSADTTRIDKDLLERKSPAPEEPLGTNAVPTVPLEAAEVPESAESLRFVLNGIDLSGTSVYDKRDLAQIWRGDVGREISLHRLYEIAVRITQKYRDDGYVLSRAYIPAQEIDKGVARIAVVEGYIADVQFRNLPESSLLNNARLRLKAMRPLNIKNLERQMLLLNDLGGHSFRAVLQPLNDNTDAEEGGVVLSVVGDQAPMVDGSLAIDNTGSKYIGPYLSSATVGVTRLPLMPFNRTEFFGTTSVPADELKFGSVRHTIPLSSNGLTLGLTAGYSKGRPGYLLEPNDVETNTSTLGADIAMSVIRQRDQNFSLRVAIDLRKSTTDILDQAFTKDKIRSARFGARYDALDPWRGYSQINGTVSHGLDILDASEKGDPNLSRARGRPDFLKAEMTAFRTQALPLGWSVLTGFTGQFTNDPLLSAEEFGYGGTVFGRGFNPSEILGDKGFAVLAEVRHEGWKLSERSRLQPFGFYDFGKVWNIDDGQEKMASGASVGAGVRFENLKLPDLTLTLAQPLTRRVDAPQYGNGRNPRVLFTLSYDF